MNPIVSTYASSVEDFMIMNPSRFCGSNVGEDPQEFVDDFYKVIYFMGVTLVEKIIIVC